MSKKKTAKKKKTPKAEAKDATFETVQEAPAPPDVIEAVAPEPETASSEPEIQPQTDAVAPQRTGGGFVAWLALAAAILALLAFAFDFVGDRRAMGSSAADAAAVHSSVRAVRDAVAELQQNMTAMSDQLSASHSEFSAIGRQLDERLQQIESLRGRISTVEGGVASLQGISSGAKDAWLLAEAEYYMQIANAQLQLAGNPQLASLALGLADERILQLANPALTEVRRALSDELRALEVMRKPDTAGVTLTLASLAAVVDSLPIRQDISRRDDEKSGLDPELTGADRALASLRSAFDSVVSVRRTDEVLRPLIAPEAQYFLRANLALQFQAARLAILRGEEAIFQKSLDDAAAWIYEYYDTASAPVQSVLQTIADIRDSEFSLAVPDISESLRLLRQFNKLADTAATPVAEPVDEPAAEPPR